MEDWRGLFRERFVIEENTEEQYLRKHDHRTIVEELEHFIEQEIDKAREGAKKEESKKLYQSISKELYKLYSDIEYLGDLRDEVYNLSDKYEKLFKLTTK